MSKKRSHDEAEQEIFVGMEHISTGVASASAVERKYDKQSLLTLKLVMACPQGELCAQRQGHIEGLKSVGDHIHFEQFSHFCPHFADRCLFLQKDDLLHRNFMHPCKEGTNCPFLYFLPQDPVSVERYNEHMRKYYHFCHMMGRCPMLQNAIHRAHFRHTPEMNISLHLPSSSSAPILLSNQNRSEEKRDEKKEMGLHPMLQDPKTCDTCGKISFNYDRLFCSHIFCEDCKEKKLTCAACMVIQELLNEPPKIERVQCPSCNTQVQHFITKDPCGHICCLKCLEASDNCRACRREREEQEMKEALERTEGESREQREREEEKKREHESAQREIITDIENTLDIIREFVNREDRKEDQGEVNGEVDMVIGDDVDNVTEPPPLPPSPRPPDEYKDRCIICMDDCVGSYRQTLLCTHFFHEQCIQRWFEFRGDDTCPICRRDMEELERDQERFLRS